jgi:hypothetical protein
MLVGKTKDLEWIDFEVEGENYYYEVRQLIIMEQKENLPR